MFIQRLSETSCRPPFRIYAEAFDQLKKDPRRSKEADSLNHGMVKKIVDAYRRGFDGEAITTLHQLSERLAKRPLFEAKLAAHIFGTTGSLTAAFSDGSALAQYFSGLGNATTERVVKIRQHLEKTREEDAAAYSQLRAFASVGSAVLLCSLAHLDSVQLVADHARRRHPRTHGGDIFVGVHIDGLLSLREATWCCLCSRGRFD